MLGSAAQIVREELAHLLEQRRVTLEITDAARAQSLPLNQEALIIALRNLVENAALHGPEHGVRSEAHTSELQSLMRNSYAVFCLKKKNNIQKNNNITYRHK